MRHGGSKNYTPINQTVILSTVAPLQFVFHIGGFSLGTATVQRQKRPDS